MQLIFSDHDSRHQTQDLQRLALHEEAVRRVRADPVLQQQVQAALER